VDETTGNVLWCLGNFNSNNHFILTTGATTNSGNTLIEANPSTTGVAIHGTNTNDNASSGFVGQYIENTVTNQAAPTSATWSDVTSITLTAGDWDISLMCNINAGTSATNVNFGIGTASGTSTTGLISGVNSWALSGIVSGVVTGVVPPYRVSISSSTTYYLKANVTYTGGGSTCSGRISARRVR
jgi:hypothetical protein